MERSSQVLATACKPKNLFFFKKVQNQILTCASSDVMHQWICLNELYKVIENFFLILDSLPNFRPKTEKNSKNSQA